MLGSLQVFGCCRRDAEDYLPAIDRKGFGNYQGHGMKCGLPFALCLFVIGFSSCAKKPTPQAPLQPVTFAVAAAEGVPLTIDTFGNVVTIADVTLQAQVKASFFVMQLTKGQW